ncbi:ShlB/FhaC/HecB family hemolysin secretion/activation protein [Phormidium sp. FACHB-592]|uniref:ShlB/FhaC/HecB family hemolysin secretion/activation protein n=1 Tax=Stenomitos frigidus AS-A4 TaxID=2933935 RepID=A0ABV0KQE3_9CYAN|nr:ShlB/FhaC/HecB family hemolysin secretion/activation protein [Phormidium sp. FACHB-592]MBD2075653.1 ShlB/FhaC/HecB family hemolysin secretion/activation protein [Phormidium sp. FACHB-592]
MNLYPINRWVVILGSGIATPTCLTLCAIAQSTPSSGVTIPPTAPDAVEQTIPRPSESPRPLPGETPTVPPKPELQTPPTQESPEVAPPSSDRFFIRKVAVLGNTVLQGEITALTQPYENRSVTFEELLQLRSAIVQLYIKNGYITSGAFLPNNQDLSSGTVQIQVVEGELEQIEIGGLRQLREGYVRSRLKHATSPPLNQQRLEQALQLLQLDPLIQQVNAELAAGSTPGRNILRVSLKEAPAFHTAIGMDNNQSPSIGSIQGSIEASHDNLLGFGDRLAAQYGRTEGLNLYDISYSIPINARNGTLSFRYNNGDSRITEADFRDVGIRSETQTYAFGLRQPIIRTPTREFALGLSLDLRRSQTYILNDIPFSFTEGPENGKAKVTVLRFSQDWVDRGIRRVLAARSQFSFGINAFDATINNTGTDGQFFAWLGQFQWVQQLSPRNLLVARIDAQLTPDPLLSLERFSIGGVDTVRGYQQNRLVSDNGILGSVEVRVPLTLDPRILQLVPFFEVGTAWNNRDIDPDPATIASLGLGLRWLIIPGLSLRLDYGIPLISVSDRGNSLQDNGFFFSVRYQPF